ncbi:hypothetical protein C7410_10835 [Paraburkholderia silvatlantica]|uniref:Uncharacterized protein n=1 Tax=Paraburkholderia silvatlantica TaxID=321895 RepID=A0A2V4U4I1_9BURK|nr:hypothetical protein [Paraburkholderia silvatlantica]PYE23140.1 hypothetical protein C7410_10835 [Paraburkholderia silvatlantica]
MSDTRSAQSQRIEISVENLRSLNDAETSYVKAILTAIEVLAEKGGEQKTIVNLAKCASWVVENIDSWIETSCDDFISISREMRHD